MYYSFNYHFFWFGLIIKNRFLLSSSKEIHLGFFSMFSRVLILDLKPILLIMLSSLLQSYWFSIYLYQTIIVDLSIFLFWSVSFYFMYFEALTSAYTLKIVMSLCWNDLFTIMKCRLYPGNILVLKFVSY